MSSYAITGAARGLGLEWVTQLANRPSTTVFAIVRNTSTAKDLTAFAADHPNVHIIQADVSKPAEVIKAAEVVSRITGGTLDVLIHNAALIDAATAGLTPSAFSLEEPESVKKLFENDFGVSLYGTIWVTNAFLPLIEQGEQKKIVYASSGMADLPSIKVTGISYAVAYSVGKAAMNILAAKYAAELQDRGIKVLALSPGWVDTAPKNQGPRKCSLGPPGTA
jgi:NAD(P)-dependent dehydrogenase (short-subunit alcohol dehydrogenase family)